MKRVAAVVVLILIAALSADGIWRLFNPRMSVPIAVSTWWVAEARHLPEDAEVPYGTGVYVSPRLAPSPLLTGHLAFSGYCGEVELLWETESELSVSCNAAESVWKRQDDGSWRIVADTYNTDIPPPDHK